MGAVWRGARAPGARAGRQAVVAVAATCLLTVLVAWAALIGPDQVFTGPGPTPGTGAPSTSASGPVDDALRDPSGDPTRRAEPPAWLRLLVWAFLAAVLLVMLAGVLLLLRAAWTAWHRRGRPEPLPDVEFETLPADARIGDAVRADAAVQDSLLADGTPRNAIVAAWHRFELHGERAGVPRRPWETSSEFTLRVLDAAGADSAAVARLGELYREARFSRHELGEQHRTAALEALAAIRASMNGVR